jgi:hypothetical protein
MNASGLWITLPCPLPSREGDVVFSLVFRQSLLCYNELYNKTNIKKEALFVKKKRANVRYFFIAGVTIFTGAFFFLDFLLNRYL